MFKKALSEEEIKSLIDEQLKETVKAQADEISELRKMVKNQSGEIYELRKKVSAMSEGGSGIVVTEESIKEISKSIAKEILDEPEEETMKRAKPFCDENGEMNTPLSRMGYVLNESTEFTRKYISKLLISLFGKK